MSAVSGAAPEGVKQYRCCNKITTTKLSSIGDFIHFNCNAPLEIEFVSGLIDNYWFFGPYRCLKISKNHIMELHI